MLGIPVRRLTGSLILILGAALITVLFASNMGAPHIASASAPADSPASTALPAAVDLYATWSDQGLFGPPASLEVFGPNSCAANGDPFSPTGHWRNESSTSPVGNPFYGMIDPPGVHTFRIAIPPDYPYNLLRVELFDPQTGNLDPNGAAQNMNLYGSPDFSGGSETRYLPTYVERLNGTTVQISSSSNTCLDIYGSDARTRRSAPCVLGRDAGMSGAIDPNNPFWYVRMDENREPCYQGNNAYVQDANTQTRFTLYYYRQAPGGDVSRVNLAQYTGLADDGSTASANWWKTALMWVSPVQEDAALGTTPANEQMPAFTCQNVAGNPALSCASGSTLRVGSPAEPRVVVDQCPAGGIDCSGNGDFIINLSGSDVNGQPSSEADGIHTDPDTGMRYVYLDVQSLTGSSENNFSVWAGPARSEVSSATAPSFVNARQIYVLNQKILGNTVHASNGADVYGVGHLPLNSLGYARQRFPITYVGEAYAGTPMSVNFFDSDAGTEPPLILYFDNIPQDTWSVCWGSATECANEGTTQTWQMMGNPPQTFGPDCVLHVGWSCGDWAAFSFTVPSASDPLHPVPFEGGRLMVDYQGGPQDTFNVLIGTYTAGAPEPVSPDDGASVQGTPAHSWLASANAAGYQFEYANDSDFNSLAHSSGDLSTTSYTPPAQAVGTYYWHVRARNVFHEWGPWSSARSITITLPPPPTPSNGLTVRTISQTRLDLLWIDRTPYEDSFHIERSENGLDGWTEIGSTGANVTTFSDTTLSCEQTRYYRVFAHNTVGDSAPTNATGGTTKICVPAAPSDVIATVVSQSRVDLTWTDNSDNETNFKVERLRAGASSLTLVATLGAGTTSYSDKTPACGDVTYWVTATNAGGASAPAVSSSVFAIICPPAAPSGVTATVVSPTQIDLAWTDNADSETGFRIERAAAGSGQWMAVTTLDADTTSYSDMAPACGDIQYRVIATNAGGSSSGAVSSSVSAILCLPAAPYNMSRTVVSQTRIDLRWQDNSSNEDSFHIERSENGVDGWTEIGTTGANVTTYSDITLACGQTRSYRVFAHNTAGNSAAAGPVRDTTVICNPTAPSDLSATVVSQSQVDLAWTDNSDNETGFKIERSVDGTNWALIKTTAANTQVYHDNTIICGRDYQYRVKATNAGGDSDAATASATTWICAPNAARNLITTSISWSWIELKWMDNSSDETGFTVERSPAGEGAWVTIWTVEANVTLYRDIKLTCDVSYDYRVRAIDSDGNSVPSNTVTATTQACEAGTPGKLGLAATRKPLVTKYPDVVFDWTFDSRAHTYHIQISTNNRFKTMVVDQAGIMEMSYMAHLADGLYYVRVRGINSLGVAGNWSAVYKVTVDTTPPPVPRFKSAAVKKKLPRLMVFRSAGAVRYEFEISSDGGALFSTLSKGPSYKARASQALAPGSYRWRVRAYDKVGNVSDWSDSWNLNVP